MQTLQTFSSDSSLGRSATIVAAYLMHTRNLDVEAALEMIRKARPVTQ